jgi:hypothetical protein
LGVVRVAQLDGVRVLLLLLLVLVMLLRGGALIDRRLHLLQDVVDVHKVILGPEVGGHRGQVVVLGQRSRSAGYTSSDGEAWRVGGHEFCGQSSVQRSVERHQRAADLAVVGRVDLAPFGIAKEVIELLVTPLPLGVKGGGLVAHIIATRVHRRLLVIVERLVGLGLVVGVVTTVAVLVRLSKGGRVSPHGTVMVVVARGR